IDNLRTELNALRQQIFSHPGTTQKLTPQGRDQLTQRGASIRCHKDGHMANECRSGKWFNNMESEVTSPSQPEQGKDS
ncbi:hypothetical protein BGW38_010526, partial [Lunasporangiospora selenospora]